MSDGVSAPLREIKALLEDAEIPYMIVSSFASMVHGEPRTTQYLDIVIDPEPAALDHLLAHIDTDVFYVDPDTARDALRRRAMFNIIDMRSAWKIDLVTRKNRPFSREELARRAEQEVLGVIVPTASAEDTIVAKLEWAKQGASERQIRDVAGILRVRGEGIEHYHRVHGAPPVKDGLVDKVHHWPGVNGIRARSRSSPRCKLSSSAGRPRPRRRSHRYRTRSRTWRTRTRCSSAGSTATRPSAVIPSKLSSHWAIEPGDSANSRRAPRPSRSPRWSSTPASSAHDGVR